MIGFCIAAGTALAAPPLADGPSQRPDITEYLQQAAARGDPEAAAALGRLREFAAAHQVDLTSTQDVRESGKVSDLPVRLSGVAPIFLNIDAYQDLATVEELDAYRAARHRALDTLAAQSPSREIAAQVVFRGHATIHEAWNALVAADQEATSLMIDVFATIDGRRSWESRFTHHGGSAGDFLRLDDNSVDREVRSLLDGAYNGEDWYARAALDFEVYRLHVTGPADGAQRLADNPRVLLIDPETDLTDAFAHRAARIRVTSLAVPADEIRWSAP